MKEGRRRKVKNLLPLLPEHFACDDLTWYIFGHYSSLITDEELAAKRIRFFLAQALGASPGLAKALHKKAAEVQREYPDLWRRIEREGFGRVMRAAAERALRDHGDVIFLNRCSRCNALCRTPKARQCFHCGHDWHDAEA